MANDNRSSNEAARADKGSRFRLPRVSGESAAPAEKIAARPSLSQAAAILQTPDRELIQQAREASAPRTPQAPPVAAPAKTSGDMGALMKQLEQMRGEVDDISTTLHDLNDRGLAQDKVFNTLHSELQDYKNDFIYEHLKPVVRPLLFLFDSLEHFDGEMSALEVPAGQERRGEPTPARVRENIVFFREQLIESLRICEVTPMQAPQGELDPRLHKMVGTEEVAPEQDGQIVRVVRSGWYLNGRVFRPAEVVIGKSR